MHGFRVGGRFPVARRAEARLACGKGSKMGKGTSRGEVARCHGYVASAVSDTRGLDAEGDRKEKKLLQNRGLSGGGEIQGNVKKVLYEPDRKFSTTLQSGGFGKQRSWRA